jgi:hypothetical protein
MIALLCFVAGRPGFAVTGRDRAPCLVERQAAQIVAIVLDQVERVEHHRMAGAPGAQRMEVRPPAIADNYRLTIDQERCGVDAEGGINDSREAVSPIVAVAGESANAGAIPPHHQPIPVQLDFVNPERAGRRSSHLRRQAGCDEGGTAHDHAAAARSSLSAPRMTILSASSGNGRCSAFASSHSACIQTSRSSSVVRITGMALGWIGSTTAFGDVVRKPQT